jgi:capsular polysaccharide biosynthesis protein
MNLSQLLPALLRRWWLIAIPTLIAAAFALPALLRNEAPASGGFNTRFSYSAAQNLAAIPRTEGDYQDIWLSSELAVNAITDWITSSSFASEVSQYLATQGTTIDATALIGRFAADNERSVGQVFIGWASDTELVQIADAAIWVLQNRNAAYFAQLGGTPATVTLLDAPRIAPAPPPLTDRFGPIIRVGLGLLAGIALAITAHVLDPMLRRREDVESLGIPLISIIPRR